MSKHTLTDLYQIGRFYQYKCVNCGRMVDRRNKAYKPVYCPTCFKQRTKERAKERREEANDNKLQNFAQWLWDNNYLTDEAFTINLVEQYKLELIKEKK